MNIVQICPCPFPSLGGPAKTYRQFHEALPFQTVAFVSNREGVGERPVLPVAATIHTRDFPAVRSYYWAPARDCVEAERVIAQAHCVFVHNFFLYPALWTARICQRHEVPFIVVPHGILDPWALRKSRLIKAVWMRLYGRGVLDRASKILCATRREVEKAQRCFARGRAAVVNWPSELPDLALVASRRLTIRRELGIGPDDRVLVYLGRLHSMKRPLETLRLLSGMGDPRLRFLVVGPDGDVTKGQLEAEACRLGWSGLRAVGSVFGPEKFAYLGAADGYISLSYRENFNYTLAEAMGAGLPLIISSGNDLGGEISESDIAWQLADDTSEQGASAVRAFLEAPASELARRGELARTWVEQHLGANCFAQKLQGLVDEVVRDYARVRAAKCVDRTD